jgi:TonB family protein
MMYELWGEKCRPGQIALLRSGQPLAVLDLVLQAIQAPSVLIADQAFMETLATVEGIAARPRLDLRVSRGLAADFSAIGQDRWEQPVIVTASALTSDIAVSTALMASQLAIIGGYSLPHTLVESFVIRRLVATLVKCAQYQAAPVIVHDSMNLIDLALIQGAVRIEMNDPGPINAAGTISSTNPNVEPTLEQVRGHAQFLLATPKPVLLAMHMFMRGAGAAVIVEHWRTRLKGLETSSPSEAARVAQALQRLDELTLDRIDDFAQPPSAGNPRAAAAVVVPANQLKAMLASAGAVALTSHSTPDQAALETNTGGQGKPIAPQQGDATQTAAARNGSRTNRSVADGIEIKADLSLIYGKPGQQRASKKAPNNAIDTFGSNKKAPSTAFDIVPSRPTSEAEQKAAVAKIVRDVEAAAAIVSQDAIAQAVRKAEASAAIEREQAVATAVHDALVAAEQSNAVKLAAAIQEAQAKADVAVTAAIEHAKRSAAEQSAHDSRLELTAAVDTALAAAEVEKSAALRAAQAAGEQATQVAVAKAIRTAEAAADIAQARAVESAIARTVALAERARDRAVAEALEQAAIKAEQLRVECLQAAVCEAKAAAELETVAAVRSEVAVATSLLEEEYNQAVASALAQAARAAEVSLHEAVATALVGAEAAAEIAKATAIARAVAITEGLAERDRKIAVAEALARAAVDSKREMFDAVAVAVANAHAEAELAKAIAVEQAVAQIASEAELAQQTAITQALHEAEIAAQTKAQSEALAVLEQKSRSDSAFAVALAQKRERISKLSLADIAAEMSKADDAWRGKEMTARCCSLLRAMRQTNSGCGGLATTIDTEPSRLKEAYDAKLRSVLAQTEIRVLGNGGLVTLIFSVNSVGKTHDVRIVKTSGIAPVDDAAASALKRAVFPAPPLEVGGDIAYTALLHFA